MYLLILSYMDINNNNNNDQLYIDVSKKNIDTFIHKKQFIVEEIKSFFAR